MICRLGTKIMPTLPLLHTGIMWRTYNWLKLIFSKSHNYLVFKDLSVETTVCLICRQRSVSSLTNPSHWLKHKRTRRNKMEFHFQSICDMDVKFSHTTDFILPRPRVQQLVTAATVLWRQQTAPVIISPSPGRRQNTTYLLCPLLCSSMSGTGDVFAENVEFICLKFIKIFTYKQVLIQFY